MRPIIPVSAYPLWAGQCPVKFVKLVKITGPGWLEKQVDDLHDLFMPANWVIYLKKLWKSVKFLCQGRVRAILYSMAAFSQIASETSHEQSSPSLRERRFRT